MICEAALALSESSLPPTRTRARASIVPLSGVGAAASSDATSTPLHLPLTFCLLARGAVESRALVDVADSGTVPLRIGVSPLSALASWRLLGRLAQGRLTRDGGGGKSLYSRPASHQRARSSRRQAITRSAGADAVYAAGMGFGALTVCQVWRACLCRASGRGEKESNVHGWNEYAEG